MAWLPAPGWAGDRVTFRMNWYWRGIQAPFALALERRYFEQAGLDVELLATIRDRPDLVRRLVAASARGFEDASREPDSAVRAFTRLAPLVDVEAARHQLMVDLSFLFSPANVRRRIGYGPPEDWQATLDALKRYRELDTARPAEAFYTNEFVP